MAYKEFIDKVTLVREKSEVERVKLTQANDVADFARPYFKESIDIFESMFLVLLSKQNQTIGMVKISQGGIDGTVFDTRLMCKYCIDSLCRSVILVHNHPSGNLTPSVGDKSVTKKAKAALEVFGLDLLDHLIVTSDNYYSMADNCDF